MGRFHQVTQNAKKFFTIKPLSKDIGKYRIIKLHENGNVSTSLGILTLKDAAGVLLTTRRKMFEVTGKKGWYKSYDIADAWICQTNSCAHRFIFKGLSCLEKLQQDNPIATARCGNKKCNAEFETTRWRKVYCSNRCANINHNAVGNAKRNGIFKQPYIKNCKLATCGKEFTTNRIDVSYCCPTHNRQDYDFTRRLASEKIEDAIKEVMISLYMAGNRKPVVSSKIFEALTVSHGVQSIRSYLAQGSIKNKWRMVDVGHYVPVLN